MKWHSQQANELRQARLESVWTQQPQEVRLYQGGKLKARVVAVDGVVRLEMEPA